MGEDESPADGGEPAPIPGTHVMIVISLLVGIVVPPVVMAAKALLTVLAAATDPGGASAAAVHETLAGDARMMLACMALMPVVGFLVQKYILWRPGKPAFRVRRRK